MTKAEAQTIAKTFKAFAQHHCIRNCEIIEVAGWREMHNYRQANKGRAFSAAICKRGRTWGVIVSMGENHMGSVEHFFEIGNVFEKMKSWAEATR